MKGAAQVSTNGTYSKRFSVNLRKYGPIWLFLLPTLIYFLVFVYFPMYGAQIAFKDFIPVKGIQGSPWVGFKHFTRFFNSPYFSEILGNTLILSIYSLVWSYGNHYSSE